jgi:hypothetical protein
VDFSDILKFEIGKNFLDTCNDDVYVTINLRRFFFFFWMNNLSEVVLMGSLV